MVMLKESSNELASYEELTNKRNRKYFLEIVKINRRRLGLLMA